MTDGYYWKIVSTEDWLDESSGLNRLMHEGKVKLVRQVSFYGNQKMWLLIYVEKDLSIWDSWSMGMSWEHAKPDATPEGTAPGEISQVPFSHSDNAKIIEDFSKDWDDGVDRTNRLLNTGIKAVAICTAAYLLINFLPPTVRALKQRQKRKRQAA